ncbi:MAG: MFS transporter [Elusimicrobia bacterium]|nr:MFS transporter [Elusimicrobiota bacterium]
MESWRALAKLPRRVWILSASALINRAGMMALPFLTLYLTRALGFTPARAGAMLGLYGAVAFLAGPVAGKLCDRWGTTRMMTGCLTVSGLVMLAFPLAKTPGEVAAMTVLWALSTEGFRPAVMTAFSESAPPEMRKQAFALNRLAVNIGMSLGPALGGFLAAASFPAIWIVDGATTLAAACVLVAALPRPARAVKGEEVVMSARGLSDPLLLWCLLAAFPVSLVFFQHEAALPVYLVRDLAMSTSFYGLLFTVNTALIIAFEIPLNHATAAWPYRRSLALGCALFAAGFGGYGLGGGAWGIAAATAVWTFGEMTLMPSMTAYVTDISPEGRRGEYMGLYMMGFSLSFMVGPWAGLTALDSWGPGALWGGCAALGLLSAALFWRVRDAKAS